MRSIFDNTWYINILKIVIVIILNQLLNSNANNICIYVILTICILYN